MAEEKKNYVAEKLMMALWPEEFADEQPEIEAHIRDCSECREELEMLKQWDDFFRTNKDELVSSVSECPTSEALVEFVSQESRDPVIEGHITYRPDCDEQVQLLKELSEQDLLSGAKTMPTRQEKRFIEKTVSREYSERRKEKSGFILAFLESLFGRVHVPSLAAGAVAAAILVLVLLPQGQEAGPLRAVMSDVVWEVQEPAISKGGRQMGGLSLARKTIAVVILVGEGNPLTQVELQDVYTRVEIADRLGISYEFVSPRDVKKILADSLDMVKDSRGLAELIFRRTEADFLLAFEVNGAKSDTRLKGMLFQRPENQERVVLSQSGFSKDRLPERITRIGSELLLEAEYPPNSGPE